MGSTALPSYGRYITEDNLNLLGDLTNKKALEIGCGNGHSLKYVSDRGESDLWGIDISPNQIAHTKRYLSSQGIDARLVCSPMENDCGLPTDYKEYFHLKFSPAVITAVKEEKLNNDIKISVVNRILLL